MSRSGRQAPWPCRAVMENRTMDGTKAIRRRATPEPGRARAVSFLTLISRRIWPRRVTWGRGRPRRATPISTREDTVGLVRTAVQVQEALVTPTLRASRWVKTRFQVARMLRSSTRTFNVVAVGLASKPSINREASCKWCIHPLKKHQINWLEDLETTISLKIGIKPRASWLTSPTQTSQAATTPTRTAKS